MNAVFYLFALFFSLFAGITYAQENLMDDEFKLDNIQTETRDDKVRRISLVNYKCGKKTKLSEY